MSDDGSIFAKVFARLDENRVYAAGAPLYRGAGWAGVLPITRAGAVKDPPPEGYTGRDGADPDDATIAAWCARYGAHNLALRLPDGIIGLDVDAYDNKVGAVTLAALERHYGPLPPTWRSSARPWPSGIRLYRVPEGARFLGSLPGIEVIQRHHRYVVAWPSLHPTGPGYFWWNPEGELSDGVPPRDDVLWLPEAWQVGLAATDAEPGSADNPAPGEHREHSWISSVVSVSETAVAALTSGGARHDAALRGCMALARMEQLGYAGSTSALDQLGNRFIALVSADERRQGDPVAEWRRMLDGARALARITPSLGPDELIVNGEAVFNTAAAVPAQPEVTLKPEVDIKPAADAKPDDAEAPGTEGEVDLLAGVRTAAWLGDQEFAPLTYHVPQLIPEGSTLLVGPPKIGKSWLVLGVGLAIAAGREVFDAVPVAARPVFYLALEDSHRRLQDRCRRLLLTADLAMRPFPGQLDYLTTIEPGHIVDTLGAWLDAHQGAAPLVILDTLGKVLPPSLAGESSYQRDYRVGSVLKALIDSHAGAALLVNHHDRKAGAEDFVDAVSGTHGLAGAADTVIVIARKRHEAEAIVQVTGRDVVEGAYALTFDTGVWSLVGGSYASAAEAALRHRREGHHSALQADLLAFLDEHPEGVRFNDVKAALGESAARYLSRLVDTGEATKVARGLYMPVPRP